MAKLEEKGILGIKGIIFDLYNTLIDIHTDEESINTYEAVSKWLIYQGVRIPAEDLKNDYRRMAKEGMEAKWEKHPEIRVEDIFGRICKSHALRDIDEVRLGSGDGSRFSGRITAPVAALSSKPAIYCRS